MKSLTLVIGLFTFCFTTHLPEGVNDLNDLTLDEFEEHFGLDKPTDPEEIAKREEALKESEAMVKEANEKYENGEQTWFDEINEFSDLPADEFQSHTGLIMNVTERYARGLLNIPVPYDEESERYFDSLRLSRTTPPASYSAVSAGLVSPVKSQGNCGSCAAFATLALVETCFKKTVGKFGDYSEQHLVDCGYGYENLNNGCNGAAPHGYPKWLADKKPKLASETDYPYKQTRNTCPSTYKTFFQGASLTGYWTGDGTEDLLKKLVAENGAVMTGVAAAGPFSNYKGGIFAGCTSTFPDHAVVVVGYGTENGVDYWLIKNSWGTQWGEKGYMRIKRGVGMCGIGGTLVTMKCGKASGTTSATSATTTTTTAAPTTTSSGSSSGCVDSWDFCPYLAADQWCDFVADDCKKSCKKC